MAREYSEDKARQGKFDGCFIVIVNSDAPFPGGALGWKTRGSLHGDFEKVAYELETSTTSNPKIGEAKTSHGSVDIVLLPTRS